MGDKINVKLEKRELQGKKVRQLRAQGLVPGVVYGHGLEPISVQAPLNVLEKVVRDAGKHTPVHLTIDSKRKIAMIKDIDVEPVKSVIRHVSFHAVKANEPVVAEVPIRLVGEGESAAEKAGLVVLQSLEKLEVKALPMDLPDALEVSIESLAEAGDHVTVADVTVPENVELVDHVADPNADEEVEQHSVKDLVVASAYEPSALQAANEAAGGDAEDEAEVESEHGEDTPQDTQAEESRPGGKGQDEPKQSNVDANK